MDVNLLEWARIEAGLSQDELAQRAGASRTTISAYEHGRKSPTLATATRLLSSAGYKLTVEPLITFTEVQMRQGRPVFVPNRLWRLSIREALTSVTLPLSLNWSRPGDVFVLSDRRQRARCYEIVLRERMPADLRRYIDGTLLVKIWPDLVLPQELRTAWQPLIDEMKS